eukprot:2370597-Prymnesium_polylepis.1
MSQAETVRADLDDTRRYGTPPRRAARRFARTRANAYPPRPRTEPSVVTDSDTVLSCTYSRTGALARPAAVPRYDPRIPSSEGCTYVLLPPYGK